MDKNHDFRTPTNEEKQAQEYKNLENEWDDDHHNKKEIENHQAHGKGHDDHDSDSDDDRMSEMVRIERET